MHSEKQLRQISESDPTTARESTAKTVLDVILPRIGVSLVGRVQSRLGLSLSCCVATPCVSIRLLGGAFTCIWF